MWLAAAVGAPSALALFTWRVLRKHPVPGAALLVAVALLIAAIWLLRELWRRSYGDKFFDWVSAGLDRGTARFGKHYRQYLLSDLRYIDLKGLAGRFYTPELDEVYVDVALRPRDPRKVPSSDLSDTDIIDLPAAGERRLITDFLGRSRPRVLAVIGAPGSGKTTLLRHTARELCTRRRQHRRSVPILLYLRDHAAAIVSDPGIALPDLVASVLARYGLTEPHGWLDRRLRAGECMVMLDGLDEVAREEDRQAVADWVTVQVTRYSGNDFVITSRPLGYQSTPIEGAITVQTQPFTPEQVARFVHGWYLAIERHSTGTADDGVVRRAAAEADELLGLLRATLSLSALTINPLLLTMIATVHRHHGALPGSRAELYQQICQVLLWRRQAAKKLAVEPRGDQKELLVRVLAFEMMCRKVRDLTTREAAEILRPLVRRISKELSPEEFLDSAASSGLLIERESGVRAFAHLTFQEYLASAYIKDKSLQSILVSNVGDVWWREATLLYVTGTDAGPIVSACLSTRSLPALSLAFDCAEEAGELSEELQDKLDDLLVEGLAPTSDPQLRQLITGVTVARHLRSVMETSEGTRVCSKVITTGIYELFSQDLAARGIFHSPDAEQRDSYVTASRPVAGVRGSDAAAFVTWVNEITEAQPEHRLPTVSEVQDPSVRAIISHQIDLGADGIWCRDDEGSVRLVGSNGAISPWRISGDTIRAQVAEDFSVAPFALMLLPTLISASITQQALELFEETRNYTRIFSISQINETGSGHLGGRAEVQANDLAAAVNLAYVIADGLGCGETVGAALDYARSTFRARVPISELTPGELRGIAKSLDSAFDEAIVQARVLPGEYELACALGFGEAPHLDEHYMFVREIVRTGSYGQAEGLMAGLRRLLGCAYAHLLSTASLPTTRSEPLTIAHELSRAFGNAARVAEPGTSVNMSPDALESTLRGSQKSLAASSKVAASDVEWFQEFTHRFNDLAQPIIAREERLTSERARILRIMALCLAALADDSESDASAGPSSLGNNFREIAGVITWLERRHAGATQPIETILLALNWVL